MHSVNALARASLAAAVALAALAGCNGRDESPPQTAADPSAQVIGVTPAPATKGPDASGTTPAGGTASSTLSKEDYSRHMPIEGQGNTLGTLSPNDSSRPNSVNAHQLPDRDQSAPPQQGTVQGQGADAASGGTSPSTNRDERKSP